MCDEYVEESRHTVENMGQIPRWAKECNTKVIVLPDNRVGIFKLNDVSVKTENPLFCDILHVDTKEPIYKNVGVGWVFLNCRLKKKYERGLVL